MAASDQKWCGVTWMHRYLPSLFSLFFNLVVSSLQNEKGVTKVGFDKGRMVFNQPRFTNGRGPDPVLKNPPPGGFGVLLPQIPLPSPAKNCTAKQWI